MEKVKACEVTFNTMTGIGLRNITFHDYDAKIFVVGRERTKRQYKNLDSVTLIDCHLSNIEELNDKKYGSMEMGMKQRCFPAQKDDLERDLSIWHEIEDLPRLNHTYDIGFLILEAIKKSEY